jgi:hypothetical protein
VKVGLFPVFLACVLCWLDCPPVAGEDEAA